MAKSTAKAEALMRDLKERLVARGFSAVESKDAEGFPKITLGSEAEISIVGVDGVSKDVFGNDNYSFAPHKVIFLSADANTKVSVCKILNEVIKMGIDKLVVKTGADLAAAEAAAGDEIVFDYRWPTKGV